MRSRLAVLSVVALGLVGGFHLLSACGGGGGAAGGAPGSSGGPGGAGGGTSAPAAYDPLAVALASAGRLVNLEASVPSMCYTRTAGVANPCWTCHTDSVLPNEMEDAGLQEAYAFSDFGLENHWTNLFVDRSAAIATQGDDEILAYVRQDNYGPLRALLRQRTDFPGYPLEADLPGGVDADGFLVDGTGWRALRYKPFLGTFWPTNGSTDDVFIRLPRAFREDGRGVASLPVAKINLAILEAALCGDPAVADADLERRVEPVDETVAGVDLDGNGQVGGLVELVRGLPARYVGGAAATAVRRYLYPAGVELLHTVRYIDPDAGHLLARRMKEVRWMIKRHDLDPWARSRAYEHELNEKQEGRPPFFAGGPDVGLRNAFGWQLQGWIEDAEGRLRLQTQEEHQFCMGCHSAIGVTVDSTFAFARKLPGAAGWRWQDARGVPDVPQAGHPDPETLTYFRRVGGGDEFRANQEVLERFFPGGTLDEAAVRRAAPGGDRDLAWLIAPSRPRALLLNKAYRALVRTQSFEQGRDTLLLPASNVHRRIENGETELGRTQRLFDDGRLWLDWRGTPHAPPPR